jgi:hypothetical protein
MSVKIFDWQDLSRRYPRRTPRVLGSSQQACFPFRIGGLEATWLPSDLAPGSRRG